MVKRNQELLLRPGWAGDLEDDELRYIKGRLINSPRLRSIWGIYGRHISAAHIRRVAREGRPPYGSGSGVGSGGGPRAGGGSGHREKRERLEEPGKPYRQLELGEELEPETAQRGNRGG